MCIDGTEAMTLRGAALPADFQKIMVDHIEQGFGSGGGPHGAGIARGTSAPLLLRLGIISCQISTAERNYAGFCSEHSTVSAGAFTIPLTILRPFRQLA